VECYWKKSLLSQVGTTTKFIEARNLVNNKRKNGKGNGKFIKLRKKETPSGSFLKEAIEHISFVRSTQPQVTIIPQIFNYFQEHDEWFQNLDLHNLMQLFQRRFPARSPEQFRAFGKTNMKNENCKIAATKTASQSECGYWLKLR
jgi:hypothetical protein